MQEPDKDHVLSDSERQQVNDALESVLATEKFEAAPQMSAFLRYVVEQAAEGNQSRIKAFTVAVDALGKPDSFDPQNDPVVRVLAGRLRAALAAYNEEHLDAPVVITMKPGSYVPSFQKKQPVEDIKDASPDTESENNPLHASLQSEAEDMQPVDTAQHPENAAAMMAERPEVDLEFDRHGVTSQVALDAARGPETESVARLLSQPSALLSKLARFIRTVPGVAVASALSGILIIAVLQSRSDEPAMQAASNVDDTGTEDPRERSRPDKLSVFVSAIDQGNALENSLNTVVSGVISESEQLRVYRILQPDGRVKFWPEDYILTLTALDLPDETQVNMQLMEAATGRIIHSEAVSLNQQTGDHLTHEELTRLIDATRSLVSEDGPLTTHYGLQNPNR